LNGKVWERAPKRSCESNGRVGDEDICLIEPVDRIAGVFEDERVFGEDYSSAFSYNVFE
jgi:hypothetical protein